MKQLLNHTIRFLLFSNCWVALSVGMLVTGLAHHHYVESSFYWGVFAFSGTFVTYNFHRLVRNRSFQSAQISTDRGRWLNQFRTFIIVFVGIFAILAATLFLQFPIRLSTLWVLAASGMIVLGYALPIPFIGKSLREISGLKSSWITAVWILLLYFPLLQYSNPIHYADLIYIGLFTFVQIIPFDIRDLSYDSPSMKTIPQLIGIRGAQIIGTILIGFITYSIFRSHTFHFLLVLTAICALFGLWWKQTPGRILMLEFIWDGTLIVLGLYYYFI
ncbi:MAG: hypothetical protein HYZ43_03730 [Flavobacteriia bacterium]|nr:hypothetical protein [Flavobacteriia bacterium]